MAKSKAEQLAALILSMELDELHDISNTIQKLIEKKSTVEETEEQILTRRLLELRQQKEKKSTPSTSIKETSRNQNESVLAKAGRTNQRAGTKQTRSEPMPIGPRPNELYKYIKTNEAQSDSRDDEKLFGGRVERNRGNGIVEKICNDCNHSVKVSSAMLHNQSTFICDSCIKKKGGD